MKVDLAHPVRTERVRDFQPPWRTVYVYRCGAGHETRARTKPMPGAFYCPECDRRAAAALQGGAS